MKKSLLAAALTLATGGAIAQSSVTLYGNIDTGYLKKDHDITEIHVPNDVYNWEPMQTQKHGFTNGVSSASYFGIKTQEDLGEGLEAKALIEFGFGNQHVQNGSTHSLRQGWVSIGSNEGSSIKLGKIYSKNFEILAQSDASGSSELSGSILSDRDRDLDSRQGVMYSFKQDGYGFDVGYYYGKESITDPNYEILKRSEDGITVVGKGFELASHFDNGQQFGRVAYAKGSVTTSNVYGSYIEELAKKRQLLTANIGTRIGEGTKVSYTYRYHKLTAGNMPINDDEVSTASADSATSYSGRAHQINLNHMLTPKAEVFSSYMIGATNPNNIMDAGHGYNVEQRGAGYQLGARYHFSKRTNAYAMYGKHVEKHKYFEDGEHSSTVTHKINSFGVGLKHMF